MRGGMHPQVGTPGSLAQALAASAGIVPESRKASRPRARAQHDRRESESAAGASRRLAAERADSVHAMRA